MRIDKGQISGKQLMFSVICFVQGSSLLTTFIAGITMQDSWLVEIFGFIISLPLVYLYYKLMTMFPDKNLIQMLEHIFGTVLGKVIGALYLWFFLTLASLNLMDIVDFTKLTIMEKTPPAVIALICILVSSIAIRNGIKLVTRYSMLFVIITFLILIISIILGINLYRFDYFLPIFDLPLKNYIQGTHIVTTMPFGEMVVFLMINANVRMSTKEAKKYIFSGFIIGVFTVMMVILRDIAVLGNTLDMFTLPHLVFLRLVNLGEALSRMEILFAVIYIILLFFKITLLYYIVVMTVCYLFEVKTFRHMVLIAGAAMIVYGLTLYPYSVKHLASAQQSVPFIWTFFEMVLPLITFITAKMRKLPKKKEA
ncbi:MAG: endospore germination permease [Clostridiaceae bacterium]|nr:endospore germination permease [Clostridiaceae bacterium]